MLFAHGVRVARTDRVVKWLNMMGWQDRPQSSSHAQVTCSSTLEVELGLEHHRLLKVMLTNSNSHIHTYTRIGGAIVRPSASAERYRR